MIIIDKDDLYSYRFIVAKVTFLKCYNNYSLVKDYPKTNCFVLRDTFSNENFLVSLLSKPMIKNQTYTTKMYFQKKYKKYAKSTEIALLSNNFNEMFRIDLTKAMFNAWLYYEQNKKYSELLDKIYYDAIVAKDTSGILYKYYSDEIYNNDVHSRKDGLISFLNPSCFNDPFDCNCLNSYKKSMSDIFRVLCTTPDYKNILMWSYYCTNHKGYCFGYSKHNIIESILKFKFNGLCIIGRVDYKSTRPTYVAKGTWSFSDIKFLIDCTFTKYIKWKHEEEYRFVLLSENFNDNGIATSSTIPIVECYAGCKCNYLTLKNSTGVIRNAIKLLKDNYQYKLN